jgi:hypothetical protein
MKICCAILRAWLALCVAAAFGLPSQASISPAEYRQQLQDLSSRVEQTKQHGEEAKQFESELPDHVSVSDGSHEYSLSYNWLRDRLKQFQQADVKTRSVFLQQIQDHLKELDVEAQAYEKAQAASSSDQEKVNEILARREFRKAHGPGWGEILRQKILRWLAGFFTRHPLYGRGATDFLHLLVYAAVAGAFIMFAIWLKRRFARPQEDFSREIIPFAPSARGWSSWLGEARASAQQGDWRNGVHLAYWAAISFLEANGAWKPDRARTPREYLRILGTRKPQYPTLSALTRKFEVIWYGRRDAQETDFSEVLQQLEKLGCK